MDFRGLVWGGKLDGITKLLLHHDGQTSSLLEKNAPNKPRFDVSLPQPGQYLLGFSNKNSFIELSADEFENYVTKEGLGHIVEERAKLGESAKPGKEVYQRSVKSLMQVGAKGVSTSFDKLLGLPLEVTPQADPYNPSGGSKLPFLVTFQGKPVKGARVMVWHRSFGEVEKFHFQTNDSGLVEIPIRRSGDWMVNTVYMERAKAETKADWQSYWSSFTFGY